MIIVTIFVTRHKKIGLMCTQNLTPFLTSILITSLVKIVNSGAYRGGVSEVSGNPL